VEPGGENALVGDVLLVRNSEETGTFRLGGVPAGLATLEAFYSGLDPQPLTVHVAAGGRVERDINLTNKALYGDQGGIVQLDAFVASSSKLTEGESLATHEQRFAANLKNVVATDAYGDVIEGNVAEFMKNLPGITIEYSDVMPLAVSVRGFDPNLTHVTSDGATLANASRNGQSRQFDFMQVSINNVSRIEVTKVPRPQDPASGISGSVNMVSKSAFERSRAQLNYRLFVSASSDGLMLKKQPFPFDTYERRVNPGFDFDFTLPLTRKLGLVFTALHSKAWNEQNQSQTIWNATAASSGRGPCRCRGSTPIFTRRSAPPPTSTSPGNSGASSPSSPTAATSSTCTSANCATVRRPPPTPKPARRIRTACSGPSA
jgi:hypothetical protein